MAADYSGHHHPVAAKWTAHYPQFFYRRVQTCTSYDRNISIARDLSFTEYAKTLEKFTTSCPVNRALPTCYVFYILETSPKRIPGGRSRRKKIFLLVSNGRKFLLFEEIMRQHSPTVFLDLYIARRLCRIFHSPRFRRK